MKYKVFNDNVFNVGLRFDNDKGREVTIKGKRNKKANPTFVMLEEDDVLYIDSISKLFEDGVIYVEDQSLLEKMGYVEKNTNVLSTEEIEKILKAPNPKLKKEVKEITSKHTIEKVIDAAKELDLPTSKIQILEEQFGKDIFEEINEDIV